METRQQSKTASFTIQGRLSGLNEYTAACRSNCYAGANMKKKNERMVESSIFEQLRGVKFDNKVSISYTWYEKNKRRDLDNIAFAKKFIQDALVKMGVLQGDGWQHIIQFTDDFKVDKNNPRIEVIITENKESEE